jgi:pentatricopeptide repeat protein
MAICAAVKLHDFEKLREYFSEMIAVGHSPDSNTCQLVFEALLNMEGGLDEACSVMDQLTSSGTKLEVRSLHTPYMYR